MTFHVEQTTYLGRKVVKKTQTNKGMDRPRKYRGSLESHNFGESPRSLDKMKA